MRRRTTLVAASGLLLSGCLRLTEEPPESSRERTGSISADESDDDRDPTNHQDGGEESRIVDVELTEVHDFGRPPGFAPSFVHEGRLGGVEDDRIVLMSTSGERMWRSSAIESDYSFANHFLADDRNGYVWFHRDGGTLLRAFDMDGGDERWTHELTGDREDRRLDEIILGDGGVYYALSEEQRDKDPEGLAIGAIVSEGGLEWETTFQGEGSNRGLARYDGAVYVGLSRGLFELDSATGDVQREYGVLTTHRGLTRSGSVVYIDTRQGIRKFDMDRQETVWSRETDRDLASKPVIDDDRLVVASTAGWVDAYSTEDGSHLWETRLTDEIRNVALGENVVWSTDLAERLYALSLADGEIVYERRDGRYRTLLTLEDKIVISDYDHPVLYEVEEVAAD